MKPLKKVSRKSDKPPAKLEAPEQMAFVQWFRMQYGPYSGALMANMAGIKLSGTQQQRFAQMAKQKAMGFKKGVSDIHISVPNAKHAGLWIEFKKPGSTIKALKPEQITHLELMNNLGYYATWADSFESAQAITKTYMKTAVKLSN